MGRLVRRCPWCGRVLPDHTDRCAETLLRKAAARVLHAYRVYIDTDDLDQLQEAMTGLEEVLAG